MRVVVMGVAGSGKTTVGTRLADRLGATFLDADGLHPQANVDKMSAGVPLDDEDRAPWLERVRDELGSDRRTIVACSALKRRYRDVLRAAGGVRFVFLDLDPDSARQRAGDRRGHFMSAGMIESQFATLQRPTADETDVFVIDASGERGTVVDQAALRLVTAFDKM